MPEHLHYDHDTFVNRETHHEESDVNVRALLLFVVVFVLFAAVTHILLYFMFRFFVRIENGRTNAPLTAIQRPAGMDVPVEPRLQPFPNKTRDGQVIAPNSNTPVTDMEDMRAIEEKAQTTYGWVDQQKGVVRLPIEQAKQLLLQRGVTVVAAPDPVVAPATTTAAPSPALGPGNAPRTPPAGPTEGGPNAARIAVPVTTSSTTTTAGSAHP